MIFFFSFSFLQMVAMLSHTTPEKRLLLCKPVSIALSFEDTLLFSLAVLPFAKPIAQTLHDGAVGKASASATSPS